MYFRGHLIFLVAISTFILAVPTSALPDRPSDKPPASEDVERELQRLRAVMRRLHGYVLAHQTLNTNGSQPGNISTEARVRVIVCPEEFAPGALSCNDALPEAVILETDFLTPPLSSQTFLFDENSHPEFEEAVSLLTNGNGIDFVRVETQICVIGGACGGGSGTTRETVFAGTVTPIAPGHAPLDFEGLEIERISVWVQNYFELYDSDQDHTEYSLAGEVFLEMSE